MQSNNTRNPAKNVTNVHKNMTISSKKTTSHILDGLPHRPNYDFA